MQVIGIVGGVASGKSQVAEQFRRLGAQVIRADEIGHEVLREPEVERALRARWGEGVCGPDGHVDRSAVARIVFAPGQEGTRQLKFLESVTHPRISASIRRKLDEFAERNDVPAVILDAAVLLEAGWHNMCDRLIFVDTSREQRLERANKRGWAAANVSARESAQVSLEEKRKVADGVIDNSGSLDHTFAQVQQFWHALGLSHP